MLRSILFYLAGCASTFALGWIIGGIWDAYMAERTRREARHER